MRQKQGNLTKAGEIIKRRGNKVFFMKQRKCISCAEIGGKLHVYLQSMTKKVIRNLNTATLLEKWKYGKIFHRL